MTTEAERITQQMGCTECGCVIPVPEDEFVAREDYDNLDAEAKSLRRSVKALRRELADKRRSSPLYGQAKDAFEYWRQRCRNGHGNVKFTEDREKAILARLKEGFELDEIKRAIDYIAAFPCVADGKGRVAQTNREQTRYDDIALHICKEGSKLERYATLGEQMLERAKRERERRAAVGWRVAVVKAARLFDATGTEEWGEEGAIQFDCPLCRMPALLRGREVKCFAGCEAAAVDQRLRALAAEHEVESDGPATERRAA